MKKLLFISYFFPPIRSIESTMALNSVKYLSDFGWEVTVICAEKIRGFNSDTETSERIPKNTQVHRTRTITNLLFRGLSRLKLIPDPEIGWVTFASRAARKALKYEKFDVIVSRSNPISSHLALLRINKYAQLPSVLLFGDLWTQNPYITFKNPFIKKINERVEQKILEKADKIILTTDQTKSLAMKKYNFQNKFVTMPNSYDPEEFAQLQRESAPLRNAENKNKMTITYTGSLYGLRSPEPFLKALRLLLDERKDLETKVAVRFVGPIGKFKELISTYRLESSITLIDGLPRQEALREIFTADILLLIDAPEKEESIFLPGKLVEYFLTKKPILGITPAKGASADAIRLTNTGIVVSPDDISGIKKAIEQYYAQYVDSGLHVSPNQGEIEQFSAKTYGKKFARILDSLAQPNA